MPPLVAPVTSEPRAGSSRDWPGAVGLAAGVAADHLFGDPRRGHPVAGFGWVAARLERLLYADSRPAGAGHLAVCLLAAGLPAAAVGVASRRPLLRAAAVAAAGWTVTGARTLRATAEQVAVALDGGDVRAARGALPGLCGRDPDPLAAADLARAAVESVAENTCDAAVGPLLWGALAGPGGLALYRAVNTLDAMVGHRSPRHRRFGAPAARLDDVANWAPARLTAALAAVWAPLVGGDPRAALRVALRDGTRHPSPNAGWPEAAFAGALGVRLGGPVQYGGRLDRRPELGSGRPPEPRDIRRAMRLSCAVTWSATALCAGLALLPHRDTARRGPGTWRGQEALLPAVRGAAR